MHGVTPLAWATDVIEKLQEGWPTARLDELLLDAWVAVSLFMRVGASSTRPNSS